MDYCGKISKFSIDATTTFMGLNMIQFPNQNISLALQARKKLKDELLAQGEAVSEDLFLLMRLLKSCTIPQFGTYIEKIESDWEDGSLTLTAPDLAPKTSTAA